MRPNHPSTQKKEPPQQGSQDKLHHIQMITRPQPSHGRATPQNGPLNRLSAIHALVVCDGISRRSVIPSEVKTDNNLSNLTVLFPCSTSQRNRRPTFESWARTVCDTPCSLRARRTESAISNMLSTWTIIHLPKFWNDFFLWHCITSCIAIQTQIIPIGKIRSGNGIS